MRAWTLPGLSAAASDRVRPGDGSSPADRPYGGVVETELGVLLGTQVPASAHRELRFSLWN